jgi:glycosyltransferase involved in cell wall biosynthesis
MSGVQVLRRRPLIDRLALRRLRMFCAERGIRVIHAHDAASQFVGALLRLWRPHLKLVMTYHRSLGFESARLRDRIRNALATAQSGAVVAGSRERWAHFLNENWVPSHKVVHIPFGINTARFRPNAEARAAVRREFGLGPERIVLGAIGHFRPEKGIDQVLQGFALLARRPLPGAPVLIVLGDGTPAERAAIRHWADQIPSGQLLFTGFRADVERVLQGFDVFVHAPRLEAFGLVVVEAMAASLPLVATKVGGILDLVRDGKSGLLVPCNAPECVADALERLIVDPALRRSLGEAAHRIALSEYGADLYAQRYLALYEDLLAGRRPKGIGDE